MLDEHVHDPVEERLDGVPDVFGVPIARCRPAGTEINLQRHRLHADRHEPVLPDQIEQRDLVRDVLEVAPERFLVAAVGRRRHAEDEGVLIEIAERAEVTVRENMVGFVHNDQAEMVARPALAAGRAGKRLHARNDHRRGRTSAVLGGKSFIAERIAFALLGCADRSRVKTIQFHQSYGYEDFIQGWRPNEHGGFTLRNGHFYEFCRRAQADSENDYVLVIDEINRGNLSRIFGEMMVLLEPDKRGPGFAMPLTYSPGETFYVPERLHIIGLMNTADRSLAMVDYALRRRFGFIAIEPSFASPNFERALCQRGASPELVNRIRVRVHEVNRMITDDAANLGRGYVVGHSFFVPRTQIEDGDAWYRAIIEWEILPLLHEYWVDDPARLERVRSLLLD